MPLVLLKYAHQYEDPSMIDKSDTEGAVLRELNDRLPRQFSICVQWVPMVTCLWFQV